MLLSLSRAFLIGTMFIVQLNTTLAMSEPPSKPSQKYILKFKENVSDSRKSQVIEQLGLVKEKELSLIGAIVCVPKEGEKGPDPLQKARSFPEIKYIEPDFQVQIE